MRVACEKNAVSIWKSQVIKEWLVEAAGAVDNCVEGGLRYRGWPTVPFVGDRTGAAPCERIWTQPDE